MDTSTSCNSTSTSAPVKLDLRLLDWCSLSTFELLSHGFGRFRLHTSLRLRALIRSWWGVYVCKFRCTSTRVQFKKTLASCSRMYSVDSDCTRHYGCVPL